MHSWVVTTVTRATPLGTLVQYRVPGGTDARVGIVVENMVLRLPRGIPDAGLMALLDDWSHWAPQLRELAVDQLDAVPAAELVAPLTYPRKILCAGVNYYDHALEMGTATPDATAEPFFFLKSPTTVVGPGAVIRLPGPPSAVDYEAELGVVLGRSLRHADSDQAAAAIAGYVVANDLSDRGRFPRPDAVAPPFGFDWLAHKSQDGFCPIGPGLVPSWLVEDVNDLAITLDVNGVRKQSSDTGQMVVRVPELLSAASRLMTLEAGDLVLTGTPAGVGLPRQDFLRDGDVVTVAIGGLGSITHTLASDVIANAHVGRRPSSRSTPSGRPAPVPTKESK